MVYLRCFLFLFLTVLSGFAANTARAADEVVLDAALTQSIKLLQMTKSACLISMGAPAKFHVNLILSNTDAFRETVNDLALAHSDNIELQRVHDAAPAVLASVAQIAHGDRHPVPYQLMLTLSGHITDQFEAFIQTQALASGDDVSKAIAIAMRLEIAAQEMVRDVCLMTAGLEGDAPKARLTHHLETFEHTIANLIDGNSDKQIAKAPSIQVKFALKDVLTKWKAVRPVLEASVTGNTVPIDEIMLASVSVDAMAKKLKKALKEYAKAA